MAKITSSGLLAFVKTEMAPTIPTRAHRTHAVWALAEKEMIKKSVTNGRAYHRHFLKIRDLQTKNTVSKTKNSDAESLKPTKLQNR